MVKEIETSRLINILHEARGGSKEARDRAILESLPIAKGMSSRYQRMHTSDPKGVLAEAVLGVIEGVDSMIKGIIPPNPRELIAGYVRRRALDYIGKDRVIPITVKTLFASLEKGKFRTFRTITDEHIGKDNCPCRHAMVINDLLDGAELTTKERTVVELLMQSHTDAEVAKLLSLSERRIGQIRSIIGNKILSTWGKGLCYGQKRTKTCCGGNKKV